MNLLKQESVWTQFWPHSKRQYSWKLNYLIWSYKDSNQLQWLITQVHQDTQHRCSFWSFWFVALIITFMIQKLIVWLVQRVALPSHISRVPGAWLSDCMEFHMCSCEFPYTPRKHASKWIGYSKFSLGVNECVCVYYPVFLPHTRVPRMGSRSAVTLIRCIKSKQSVIL